MTFNWSISLETAGIILDLFQWFKEIFFSFDTSTSDIWCRQHPVLCTVSNIKVCKTQETSNLSAVIKTTRGKILGIFCHLKKKRLEYTDLTKTSLILHIHFALLDQGITVLLHSFKYRVLHSTKGI